MGPGKTMAPTYTASKRILGDKKVLIRIVLKGLTGPIDGKSYAMVMTGLGTNMTDEALAGVLTYIRNSFGNKATAVTAAEVKAVREATKDRTKPYTLEELAKLNK